jgi:two-component system, response regulator YesN
MEDSLYMKETYKVLIVDDEMLIRQGIINYIDWENEGYTIIGEASNGEEALQLMKVFQPHIIITDIVMPGMDGIDLVRNVKKEYPNTEVIVLSSFENFDYVKQTFQNGVADYILKPKLNAEELLHTLKKVTQNQSKTTHQKEGSSYFQQILQKTLIGYQSIREMEELLHDMPEDTFVLIEVMWKELHAPLSNNVLVQKFTVEGFAKAHYISSKENGYLYLINYANTYGEKLMEMINEINASFSHVHLQWVVSKAFSNLQQLKDMYENNHKKLVQHRFYLPQYRIIRSDHLPPLDEVEANFDLNHMIYLFKRKQFNDAFLYLNKHVAILSQQYDTDVFEFQSWLENIIFNIIVLLGNMDYDVKDLEKQKYYYFSQINEAFDVSEALNAFEVFLAEVAKIVLPNNEEELSNIQLLLDYIEENYNQHLTLRTLAKHFHFNPSYLSSYFSKHHKEGFSEYLNNVRINKAISMLQSTNMSISSISEAVGYSDPSYFTKVFKKLTNSSPSLYRKKHRQN